MFALLPCPLDDKSSCRCLCCWGPALLISNRLMPFVIGHPRGAYQCQEQSHIPGDPGFLDLPHIIWIVSIVWRLLLTHMWQGRSWEQGLVSRTSGTCDSGFSGAPTCMWDRGDL